MSKQKINFGAGVAAFGDSFTNSQGATAPAYGYINRLAASVGGGLANYAVSGQGTYIAARNGMGAPLRRRNVVAILAGLNDARRAGLAAKDKIVTNLRALIIINLLASNSLASSLPRVGAWKVLPSTLVSRSSAKGGSALYTADINAAMTYKFSGDAFVIGSITTHTLSSSSYQDWDFRVDGGPRQTFENYNLTNEAYSHNARIISGLGAGPHTVQILPKSAVPWSVIDYFGVPLAEPKAAGPILVGQIPYLKNWVYLGFTLTPAIVDELNQAIADMVAEFEGYPVALVRTNDFYNTLTGCSADGIHPNNTGYAQIYSAFMDKLEIWT
ncbi:MAG: SGNH/GDSL hydrolase family protein [Methylocystis sp.]|uniref:SGNH/GDSL hydrolase family protein n=1 Tax=Methylocystis sp. TaxID=1911079 RepID=UPI003DA61356